MMFLGNAGDNGIQLIIREICISTACVLDARLVEMVVEGGSADPKDVCDVYPSVAEVVQLLDALDIEDVCGSSALAS